MDIIYIYDTYCGWCKVAQPKVYSLYNKTKEKYKWSFYHRNLFTDAYVPQMSPEFINMVENVNKTIYSQENYLPFSDAYLNLIKSNNFSHDSKISAIASLAMKLLYPTLAFDYSIALQNELFENGKQIDFNMAIEVAKKFNINHDKFIKKLTHNDIEFINKLAKEKATKYMEHSLSFGVPSLLLHNDHKLEKIDINNPYKII